MTIKRKLLLNTLLTLLGIIIIGSVSFIGLKEVKEKIYSLTEKSTPFQLKTVEFTRAVQEHMIKLYEISAVKSDKELEKEEQEIGNSLNLIKDILSQLFKLRGGDKESISSMISEMQKVTDESVSIVRERIKAERKLSEASEQSQSKLSLNSKKLSKLDLSMKELQKNAYKNLSNTSSKARNITSKLTETQKIKDLLQEIQISLADIQAAQSDQAVVVAKDRIKYSANMIGQTGKDFKSISEMVKDLEKLANEHNGLVELKMQNIAKPGDTKLEKEFSELCRQCNNRMGNIIMLINEEVDSTNISFMSENIALDESLGASKITGQIVTLNTELTAIGLSIENIVSKLFTIKKVEDIDVVKKNLLIKFSHTRQIAAEIERTLNATGKKLELGIIKDVSLSLRDIERLLLADNGFIDTLKSMLKAKERSEAMFAMLNKTIQEQRLKHGKNVITAQEEQIKAVETVNLVVKTVIMLVFIFSIALLLTSIMFGKLIENSIMRRIRDLTFLAECFGNGDFSARMDNQKNDEFGKVAINFNEAVIKISDMARSISSISENLSESSGHLNETALNLSNYSKSQAQDTDQSTASIVKMFHTNMEVAQITENTALRADEMHKFAMDGKSSMKITATALEQFTAAVEDFTIRMATLKEKSQDIDKIVDLIIDISDGTKLISLNASVEAARAGNAGLGFSVIAQNVRELASKASRSADEIKRDVNVIQYEFVSFTKFMMDHKKSVEQILAHVKKTERVMDTIAASVKEVSGMVQSVAIAVKNQSATSKEMSIMMERISGITKNLNVSVFSINEQATDLLAVSSGLNRKIQWFKTNDECYS